MKIYSYFIKLLAMVWFVESSPFAHQVCLSWSTTMILERYHEALSPSPELSCHTRIMYNPPRSCFVLKLKELMSPLLKFCRWKQGAVSIRKTVLLGMAIPMLKIRRPTGRLIFNMGIAIPSKTVFLIETAPCTLFCFAVAVTTLQGPVSI